MVATSGRGWRLAPCLVALVEETDRLFPSRSIASDGSIGDRAHRNRDSHHNPDSSGDVRAVDITDDKMHGCDADLLAEHIVANRDSRILYVIWNGTIVTSYGSHAWQKRPYTGSNSHSSHTHISVKDTSAAKEDRSPWWPQPRNPVPEPEPEFDPMLIHRKTKPGHALLFLGGKLYEAHGSTGPGATVDDGVWNKVIANHGPVIGT